MGLTQTFVLTLATAVIYGQTALHYTGTVNSGATTGSNEGGGVTTASPTTTAPLHSRELKPPGCIPKRPPGYAWNHQGGLGVWHQYMEGIQSKFIPHVTNSVEQNRGIGWMLDTSEQTWIRSNHVTARSAVPPYNCLSAYGTQNMSCNGFAITSFYLVDQDPGKPGIPINFTYLYLEPNFMYIRVVCYDEGSNTFTQEYCETPGVSVWTRKKPSDITPLEDILVRDIVNDRLAPYCLVADDLVYRPWNDTLPPCQFDHLHQKIRDEWNFAQEHLVQKCFNPVSDGRCVPASYY